MLALEVATSEMAAKQDQWTVDKENRMMDSTSWWSCQRIARAVAVLARSKRRWGHS